MSPAEDPEIQSRLPIAVVGAWLMVVTWLADSALDAIFVGDSIWREIFHPSPHELAIRALFMSIQLLFLLYIGRCVQRYHDQRRKLADALLVAEFEKQRTQAFIDAVGDAISIQDLKMKILYQNPAHKALLGDHVGEYCYAAYQGRDSICSGCHLELSYQDGQTHLREISNPVLDGDRIFEIVSTPLRDTSGNIVAGIEAVRDVTERKHVELQISGLNKELELRAGKLEEANRELAAFNYSLSHDLRSFITRISTAQQVLEVVCPDTADAAFPLHAIGDACQGMEDLIEAMLTLSHVSRRGVRIEEVSVSELAEEVFLQLKQQEMTREVKFSLVSGITVRGDRYLLKLAVTNLLENAWKYTRDAEKPQIELGTVERDGKRFIFVRDNGVGFSMSEKDKLFVPFKRLETSKGFAGNGIGLATVERVVRRHGGEVSGEGEPGKGAVIYFYLPDSPKETSIETG